VIYLDSAAVIKLIRVEDETPELVGYLNARGDERLVASALIEVEVPRALRRSEPAVLGAVAATIARIDRVEIDSSVRAIAAAYTDPHWRSLDAIHLATADHLLASGKRLSAFVTYDKRLADRAGDLGVVIAAPGKGS
jgi:predicted nucleic acid-binding protein